jgi:hypothetical protein
VQVPPHDVMPLSQNPYPQELEPCLFLRFLPNHLVPSQSTLLSHARWLQAARLEEISGFDDDVDLKAPIEPMEHIYYGELKKVRSLVAASASTGSADTQRHYRLLLYKIDQALK